MRVADALRATSVPHRLRVGDKFSDTDGEWEVAREPKVIKGNGVRLWLKRHPGGVRARAYDFDPNKSVSLIRN